MGGVSGSWSARLRLLSSILVFACCFQAVVPACAAEPPALERGAAITDPLALRELDRGRFAVGRILCRREQSADIPLEQRASCSLCRP